MSGDFRAEIEGSPEQVVSQALRDAHLPAGDAELVAAAVVRRLLVALACRGSKVRAAAIVSRAGTLDWSAPAVPVPPEGPGGAPC